MKFSRANGENTADHNNEKKYHTSIPGKLAYKQIHIQWVIYLFFLTWLFPCFTEAQNLPIWSQNNEKKKDEVDRWRIVLLLDINSVSFNQEIRLINMEKKKGKRSILTAVLWKILSLLFFIVLHQPILNIYYEKYI